MRERAALGTKGGKMIRGVHEERGEAVVGRLSRRVCGRGKFSTRSDVMLSTMRFVLEHIEKIKACDCMYQGKRLI